MKEVKLDNLTLLRLVDIIESGDEVKKEGVLADMASNPNYIILTENDLLRSRLKTVLELDAEVRERQLEVEQCSFIARKFKKDYKDMKVLLQTTKEKRDKAWSEYEMLRRLVCYDNDHLDIFRHYQ